MNGDEVVRRLLAFQAGQPIPLGETIHFPIASGDDLLLLVFVKMGGESAPWGIAWARESGSVSTLTVPEPRNRDAVAAMLADFASTLLSHLAHPVLRDDGDQPPFRQLWLPNPTHVDMLHHLSYTYTFTRFGAPERALILNALGRAAGFLFRESQRPGQVTVMDAAAALRESFTFPTETIRQHHLGFLLAWLETNGDGTLRAAAAREMERKAIATNLDPDVEREVLQPVLDRYTESRRAEDVTAMRREAGHIEAALVQELERRVDLVRRAVRTLRGDGRRENRGLPLLMAASREEREYQYARIERRIAGMEEGPAYVADPETDRHPAAAAVGFFRHEESAELAQQALIHDDRGLQVQAIAAGNAVRGTITAIDDEGVGRRTTPVWTIRSPDTTPLRVRAGNDLCVVGLPRRVVRVREVEGEPGQRTLVVEVTGLKLAAFDEDGRTVPAAAHRSLVGSEVMLVPVFGTGISLRKRQKVWERGGPGAWLTHAAPPPRRRRTRRDGDADSAVDLMLGDR